MRLYTRIVFGANALYQAVLGFVCLLAPQAAIAFYGGAGPDGVSNLLQIAFRLLGVHLIPAGVVSVLIAGNPDSYPVLRPLMGLLSVLNLVCWGIVLAGHDLSAGQIATVVLNALVQVLLLVAVVFYATKSAARARQIVTRRTEAA